MLKVVCFGEVLWDVFPTEKKIGGAPLNVALRLQSFGNDVSMISAVGNDTDGQNIIEYLSDSGIDTALIPLISNESTSHVNVQLDKNGSAKYTIEMPCAWDFIELNDAIINKVKSSDAFIFGSLTARMPTSYKTLSQILESATLKVFDVNLRPPHYTIDKLLSFMCKADIIKFNDEELLELSRKFGSGTNSLIDNVKFISERTNTQQICVTLGSNGALLYIEGVVYRSRGYEVKVEDTVGAGDSFLATLVNGLLKDENPQVILEKACAIGALVASRKGANPILKESDITNLIS
ncbi:carbohydrate kinase [uncultured Winogradskyella sp.]|uniref:carbohydrate kinase family protein n=1 Tax=uncultured Winogradskyella sp. TaxID=395353 RepID=UPI002627D251|nr:carbohydrate kinase [uncultured Winogradskyella sp.]